MLKKSKIFILSVLKPVDDVRNYHKIGKSLAKSGYEITITGFGHIEFTTPENIYLKPIYSKNRLHISRFFLSFNILKLYFQTRPQILIVSSIELLPISLLLKFIFSSFVIYDIQENYTLNYQKSQIYSKKEKFIIPFFLKFISKIAHRYCDQLWLAEKCYYEELNLVKYDFKSSIFENKSNISRSKSQVKLDFNHQIKFLFSGTINESTGIEQALFFYQKFKALHHNCQLTIIGKVKSEKYYQKLKLLASYPNNNIKLQTSIFPVDHQLIENEIFKADIGLISYQLSEHTIDKYPTKLFEYMASSLVIISQQGNIWNELIQKYDAGIILDFNEQEAVEDHLEILKNNLFYTKNQDMNKLMWSDIELKLVEKIKSISNK